MSNASTIYVQDDETTTSYIRTDHENMAYVEEEDPRNDWGPRAEETQIVMMELWAFSGVKPVILLTTVNHSEPRTTCV